MRRNVIFQDYIKAILALNQTESIWSLVATGEIRSGLSGMAERGTGNGTPTSGAPESSC